MMELLKANFQGIPISSLKLDLISLKKLVELVTEINLKAKKLEEENIRINSKDPGGNIPKEEVENYVKKILENYLVAIEITEFNGNYSVWYNQDQIFKEEKFPDNIRAIRISNTNRFINRNDLFQFFRITINLDFSKSMLLNFMSNPSLATSNQSFIEIGGLDTDWVNSSLKAINDYLANRKNNKSWIHKSNVYDLFLWFIIIPLVFWNLQKVETLLDNFQKQISGSFKVFVLLYSFLIGLFVFNFIFKYARWLYPPIELSSQIGNSKKIQRLFLFLIISAIIVRLIIDLFFGIIPILFS
jgi:hypothetical protein